MQHPKTLSLKSWGGLNNRVSAESTPQAFLKRAENVDIDKAKGITKRKGYTLVDSAEYTCIWSSDRGNGCWAVRNGDLVEILPDYSYTTLIANFNDIPSFTEVDDKLFFISPSRSGMIRDGTVRNWGVPINSLAPTLTATSGSLLAGDYQVGFTYVYTDGLEGGMTETSTITLTDGQGISTYIPASTDPDVIMARVYCSTQNGMELFYSKAVVPGNTAVISDQRELINPLRFFNAFPAPLGQLAAYYRGHTLIADGKVLYYSEPFQYEHFKLDSNYYEFSENIIAIMPVEDGIWVAADKLYYLSGTKVSELSKTTKEEIEIVPGTATKISGSYLRLDNTPIGYKWLVTTNLGIFVLFNQGLTINLTSENVSLERADRGTSFFLQDNGLNQYVSVLKTNERPNNSAIGDFVEAQIIRNGVIIN